MRYFKVSDTHKVQTNSKRNKNVIQPHIIIKKLECFKLSPTLSLNTEQLETQQSQKHKWLNSKLRAFDALLSHMTYCLNINYWVVLTNFKHEITSLLNWLTSTSRMWIQTLAFLPSWFIPWKREKERECNSLIKLNN